MGQLRNSILQKYEKGYSYEKMRVASAENYKEANERNQTSLVALRECKRSYPQNTTLAGEIHNHRTISREKKILSARKIKDFNLKEEQLLRNILKINSKNKKKMDRLRKRVGLSSIKFDKMVNSLINNTITNKKTG